MQRTLVMALLLTGTLASQAVAQATSGPPSTNPPAPAPRTESEYYVPLFGVGRAHASKQVAKRH